MKILLKTTAVLLAFVFAGVSLVLFAQSRTNSAAIPEYVAMGSSFAAGPGISPGAGGPFLCTRSKGNYAHLLAKLRGLSLRDVSCSGASTRHILTDRQWFQSPQIEAVDERTRLVTITIGGNDIDYIGSIMACQENANWLMERIAPCDSITQETLEEVLSDLEDKLVAIALEIQGHAPAAERIFVTYPAVLPPAGICTQLGLSEEYAARVREIAEGLLTATRNAAQRSSSLIFDAHSLGAEHNVCAENSWIFSASDKVVAAFHPNAAAMQAIARGLDSFLN